MNKITKDQKWLAYVQEARVKEWNAAIDKAIDTLRYSPGGASNYTLEKLESLKK